MAQFKAETSQDRPRTREIFFYVRNHFYPIWAWEFPKK